MSFYSYKNANPCACPGAISGSALDGLQEKVCVQVKRVYDSCLQQEQLDDRQVVISNVVPVLPANCQSARSGACACSCNENVCTCACNEPLIGSAHCRSGTESACWLLAIVREVPRQQPFAVWTIV